MSNRAESLRLRLHGLTYAEIAKRLGISRQRVQQLTSPPAYIRGKVIEKAGGKCEDCGHSGRDFHVHHVECTGMAYELYNDLDNLRLLCPSCHRYAHPFPLSYSESTQPVVYTLPTLTCLRCRASW